MAVIRKRGDRWQAQVYRRGVRVSGSFGRKANAVAWAAHVEVKIEAGTYGAPASDTFGDVANRYAAEVSPTKRGARWEQCRIAARNRGTRPTPPPDRLWTVGDVAAHFHVAETTACQITADPDFPAAVIVAKSVRRYVPREVIAYAGRHREKRGGQHDDGNG